MSGYSFLSRVFRKISFSPLFAFFRRKRLTNTDFSIISNNCWGGVVYEWFNLEKKSPTVGCYFFAEDYIRFASNLKYYLSQELQFISATESKYADILKKIKQLNVPVGLLGDVEVVFLHYRNPEVAKEKWERRVKRINWENIILKFSYASNCSDELIEKFEMIGGVKRILLSGKSFPQYIDCCVIPGEPSGNITNDTFYINRHVNLIKLINSPQNQVLTKSIQR